MGAAGGPRRIRRLNCYRDPLPRTMGRRGAGVAAGPRPGLLAHAVPRHPLRRLAGTVARLSLGPGAHARRLHRHALDHRAGRTRRRLCAAALVTLPADPESSSALRILARVPGCRGRAQLCAVCDSGFSSRRRSPQHEPRGSSRAAGTAGLARHHSRPHGEPLRSRLRRIHRLRYRGSRTAPPQSPCRETGL